MPRNFETEDTDQLDRELEEVSPKKEEVQQPAYKVMGDNKIPVSKHHGKLWQGRKDAGKKARSQYEDAWKEAIKYFMNDQLSHRTDRGELRSGNEGAAKELNNIWSETENIVFANTTTLLPALYAKNPVTEFTAADRNNSQYATVLERLVNIIFWMKTTPGVNLKPKARKAVLNALLTNCGWVKIGWTFKDASAEGEVQKLQELGEKLANAKDTAEILEIEGELQAIERHLDVLDNEGPYTRFVSPFNHVIDPEAEEPDLSDCKWMMECMYMPTEYLNARYGQKDKDGNIVSVYKPTHVLKATSNSPGSSESLENEVNNFSLFNEDEEPKYYGYEDRDAYNAAQRTLVWICWDRTTRRVYMFADNDWSWPLWVWNDPYQLNEFFPYYNLAFYDNPEGWYSKGEVTYYLDQQDAINEINDEERRARLWVKRNVLFDLNSISREDAEQFLKGDDGTARGVDVPEDKKMTDVIFTMPPPSMRFPELFDTSRKLDAIDRIASVSDVLRGAQFKANTTNDAVETYNSANQMRLDEKIDKIEDFVGNIGWGLAQMCVRFMTSEEVQQIVGPEVMKDVEWRQMSPRELSQQVSMRVVGGSTAKPTSRAKKKEAVEAGQVIGQFADAAPHAVLIMLRMFEQAFDEVVIRDEDWEQLKQGIMMQQQQAGAGPGGSGAEGGGQPQEVPPEAQQAIQNAVSKGVPEDQAREMVMRQLGGQAQGSA